MKVNSARFIASLTLLLSAVFVVSNIGPVDAATCHGIGKAKTTFRPGTITSAEIRNTTEWNYNCSTGALLTPVSLTNRYVYWNPAIDATLSNGSGYTTTLGLPSYLFGKLAASFSACDSFTCGSANYGFTLHNYVYSTTYDYGNSVRSCWIDGTSTYMPGYTLSCGT
jgi:hypothetical protein